MASSRVNQTEGPGGAGSHSWRDRIDPRQVGWLRILLIFVPVALVTWIGGGSKTFQFGLAAVAIIPLAGLIGEATESLADKLGPGVGGPAQRDLRQRR